MELKFRSPVTSGFEQLDNEATYKMVSDIYAEFVQKYSGRRSFYLSGDKSSPQYKKKVSNIRALILICTELGVTFPVYMKIQFEMLKGWLQKKGMKFPTFPMLVTENAMLRYLEWEKKNQNQFESKKEAVNKLYEVNKDYRKSIFQSAEKFKERLEKFSLIDTHNAIKELEILARMGYVTNIYVYSHPLLWQTSNEYLKKIQLEVGKVLTTEQKEILRNLRVDLKKQYGEEGVNIYV